MIDDLPDELLSKIFSFLPMPDRLRIEKVCKRWRNIGEHGWNDIKHVKLGDGYDNNATRLLLKRCGRYVKKLDLSINERSLVWLSMVIELCQLDQVEEIKIELSKDRVSVDDSVRDALATLLSLTKNVAILSVETALKSDNLLYLNGMSPEKLRKLSIKYEGNLAFRASYALLRFPYLNLLDCHNIQIMDFEENNYDEIVFKPKTIILYHCIVSRRFIENFRSSKELEWLIFHYNNSDMEDQDIRMIAQNCKRLHCLSIDCPSITSDCYREIGGMPSLEVFHMSLIVSITNYLEIKHLTNIRDLLIEDYVGEILATSEGLIECIRHSQNLQYLFLMKEPNNNSSFKRFFSNVKDIFEKGYRTKPLRMDLQVFSTMANIEKTLLLHPSLEVCLIHGNKQSTYVGPKILRPNENMD